MKRAGMHCHSFGRRDEYVRYFTRDGGHQSNLAVEQEMARAWQGLEETCLNAHCAACDTEKPLRVDRVASLRLENGEWQPNWRERLICADCGLNTRQRLLIDDLMWSLRRKTPEQRAGHRLYASEQFSPFYDWLWANSGLACVGSEYLGPDAVGGSYTPIAGREVRHEDVQQLSFDDESIDFLCSNDVLEHVDQPRRAVQEMSRVLRPGGELFLSVPFSPNEDLSRRRARLGPGGVVEHLVEAEYHHDPLSEQGALVYFNFGWDLLEWMRQAGLKRARMRLAWSRERGYLGTPLFYFHAVKPRPVWWKSIISR
jgi:SAM-dependent methyltransferase